MRPDLCAQDNSSDPRKYLGSFYTDSLVHDPRSLKLLTDVIGKVSWGSLLDGLWRSEVWTSDLLLDKLDTFEEKGKIELVKHPKYVLLFLGIQGKLIPGPPKIEAPQMPNCFL